MDLDYGKTECVFEMEVCLAGRVQSALTGRQRGKVAAANAGRHSSRWCVQLGERGDEGRINWHSGGETERGGQPLSPFVLHSFSSWRIDGVDPGLLDMGGKPLLVLESNEIKMSQAFPSLLRHQTNPAPVRCGGGVHTCPMMHLKMILQPITKLLMSARARKMEKLPLCRVLVTGFV